jgi:hypothetical protein
MKKILICLSAILCLVTGAEAFAAENDRAAKPAAKGYELYSWRLADGTWRYSLLPGTNRMKATDEVTAAAVVISDASALKRRLATLATNEQVFWHLPDAEKFSLPDPRVVEDLKTYCRVVQIDLQVQ